MKKIVGIEVWTGEHGTRRLPDGRVEYLHPAVYYSIKDKGVTSMGDDGYAGGTFWIAYEDGTRHVFPERSVRMVIMEDDEKAEW